MSEFGSEVSSSEVSGDSVTTSDVSEVDTGSEVSESEMDEDLSHELDDSYDSYMEEGEGKSFESDFDENEEVEETELEETDEPPDDLESDLDSKYDSYIEDKDLSSFEKGKATDVSEDDSEADDLDSEVDNHYNDYVEHGENDDSPENVEEGLTEAEKEKLKEETGWSEEIVDSTRSVEEAEIYKNADLKEEDINGKKCLIRSDIDMEQKDEFGRTNKERMENGNAPLTESGETVELHHIGQKQDSPLAELTTQEHRGKGNDTILHDKQKETEIDRGEFAKERKQHWESRAENA